MEPNQQPSATQTAIGFLGYNAFDDGEAYRGAILVTDESGKPLEFRCTAPVRPPQLQRTLYGKSLLPHILIELIAAAAKEMTRMGSKQQRRFMGAVNLSVRTGSGEALLCRPAIRLDFARLAACQELTLTPISPYFPGKILTVPPPNPRDVIHRRLNGVLARANDVRIGRSEASSEFLPFSARILRVWPNCFERETKHR